MPYISDMGAIDNASAVNQTGDRIRQAWQQGQARDDAEQEKNRALHPATQKWLQRVLSGELTPAQAAVGAHQEIDGLQGAQPVSPDMLASTGKLGGMDEQGQSAPVQPPAYAPPQSLREAANAPMTSRDVGDLERLAPFASSQQRRSGTGVSETDAEARIRLKAEEERKTLGVKEAGRDKRAGATITSRELIAKKELEYKVTKSLQDREMRLQDIQAKLQIAMERNSTEKEIATLKTEASLVIADNSAKAKELSSLMEQTPEMDEHLATLNDDLESKGEALRQRLGIPAKPPPTPTQMDKVFETPPLGRPPEAAPQTPPIPGVEDLPPGQPAPKPAVMPPAPPLPTQVPVQEPPAQYGAPAPDLNALPPAKGGKTGKKASAPTPTGIFKTDPTGQKWEKMSDGSARKVK